jgi:hypothetical protein
MCLGPRYWMVMLVDVLINCKRSEFLLLFGDVAEEDDALNMSWFQKLYGYCS